jgi:4-hydroxythreonine-4-phosphate dehydrogenase
MYPIDIIDSQVTSDKKRPSLVVTMGDPAGIGTEVILKAAAGGDLQKYCDLKIVGSRYLLEDNYDKLRKIGVKNIANPQELSIIDVDLGGDIKSGIIIGKGNAASGFASFSYMETAIRLTMAGEFDGIVTAPIAKSAWKQAGYSYPGQTELLAEKAGVDKFGMLFVGRSPHTGWTMRTLLATTHIPLHQVPSLLTPELMSQKLELLLSCLAEDFGIHNPRIVIAGLNPHSGEEGHLGTEEKEWLTSWIEEKREELKEKFPNVILEGPLPPDTMWVKPGLAWYGNSQNVHPADAYLALYHDQGLIPVKLMAFDRAVNTSIGLPFIRTSPDHGTGFDIAGLGVADATSMKAAIELGAELAAQKINHKKFV